MLGSARLATWLAVTSLLPLGCSSDGAAGGEPGEDAGTVAMCTPDFAASCHETQRVCVEGPSGASCEACPGGQYANLADGVCAPLQGTPLEHAFADFTVAPGEEVKGLCQSWTLANPEEIWVNAVELDQNAQSHHSNWLFAPDDRFDGPDGVWLCKERGYSQLEAALAGGVLYAQSTQARHEVQKFPGGVAVRIPPYSRIIGDVHLLNLTDEPVTGHSTLHLYSIDPADVSVKLAPFHLTYDELDIPPQARSRFSGECDIDATSQEVLGKPLDLDVYFILPHTHALGRRFFLQILGGPRDGETLFDISGFDGEARGHYYDTPVSLAGAKGFRFGCEFDNPRTEAVHWGFGDQEMCENLGFIRSDMAFESSVSTVEPAGEPDGMPAFTGACSTIAFAFDQSKAGGPAR